MKIFAIGDLHLSLGEGVDKPMDRFGPIWIDHDRTLKKNWTENISDEDMTVIAGDISWALTSDEAVTDLEWIHQLPGRKILLKGNHDLWWTGITKLNSMYDDMYFLQNTCFMAGDLAICGSRGWLCPGHDEFDEHDERIYRRELLRLEASLKDAVNRGASEIIGFLHYPPTNDRHERSGFTDLFEKYGVKEVYYGHLHGRDAFSRGLKGVMNGVRYTLISLDYIDCMPLCIREDI